ncbi:MAG: hypothetical protein QOD75_1897 [Blastocatellia bacterium]|jgi:hypothetical protein|nr:hypothetical protein [Blastocatellia bacterium]
MKGPSPRAQITELDEEFARLHRNACELVSITGLEPPEFSPAGGKTGPFRKEILRGAAVVEQTFGGLTANLWDDPFEWTLPETLNTPRLLIEYLNEVETTRRRAFDSLRGDEDLAREVVVPSGQRQTLLSLFRETISRAATLQSRAFELRDDAPSAPANDY